MLRLFIQRFFILLLEFTPWIISLKTERLVYAQAKTADNERNRKIASLHKPGTIADYRLLYVTLMSLVQSVLSGMIRTSLLSTSHVTHHRRLSKAVRLLDVR